MYAYSLLSQDREFFLESKEGETYVRAKHHELIARKIIPLIRGANGDIQKWFVKIRRMHKKIKNKEGTESDYIDLDILLGMMIDEYRS